MTKRKPGRMAPLGNSVYNDTNRVLSNNELNLLKKTTIDWEALRPEVGDSAKYDDLIKAVEESTRENEEIYQLYDRLKQLGEETFKLAKNVIDKLP